MSDFDALLLAITLGGTGCGVLAAFGVLRVQLQRPSGAARKAWREGRGRG